MERTGTPVLDRRTSGAYDLMTVPKITVLATYDTAEWINDEIDYPIETGGFTDPLNPWGGWQQEMPKDICGDEARAWMDENVTRVTFDSAWEAAEFILDFPGGVWDYNDGEAEQDYRTGVWTSVTLHVDDDQEWIFTLCDTIKTLREG